MNSARPVQIPVDAVLFDLLTGLLDSWSLWDHVAGGGASGRRWRLRYLDLCYGAGEYRPWKSLVAQAAGDAGLPRSKAAELVARWDHIEPWPEVSGVLQRLGTRKLGVVTNCSESLAARAARKLGVAGLVVVSAEGAGAYKPDSRPYRLALARIDVQAERTLFVAGSPSDIEGASRAGMRVFWHNRLGLPSRTNERVVGESRDLRSLADWLVSADGG